MFDPLDYLILGSSALGLATFFYGLLRLVWRRPRGPGERLAQRGATRIILRNLTRGGDIQRWN
jgi:hypothetical protein